MAKRYSAVKPATGSPGLIRTGGGRARVGSLPKTPKASFSIDLNLGQLREQQDHRQRVKTLRESGLYEGIDLNNVPVDKVTAMYANLPQDLRAYTKAKLEGTRATAQGDFLKEMEDIKATPKGWIGSEYDPSVQRDPTIGEELPMTPDTQRVEGDLDLSGGTDNVISNFMAGRYDAAGKRGGPGGQVPDAQIDPFDIDFPSGDEEGFGARAIEDMPRGDTSGNLEWFDIEEGFGLKKKIDRDELGKEHGSTTEWYPDGTAKSQTDYEHGEEVSRIEYDRAGKIEKVVGDPFKIKEGPPQKRPDELLSSFLDLDPMVATQVHKQYVAAQKDLRDEAKVPAFKVKEFTKILEDGTTQIERRDEKSGALINKYNAGEVDAFAGETIKSFKSTDDNGNPIQVYVKLDRDLAQIGTSKVFPLGKNQGKEKILMPNQSLNLAAYLQEKMLREHKPGSTMKTIPRDVAEKIIRDSTTHSLNPKKYLLANREDWEPFQEYLRQTGKLKELRKILEIFAGANMGREPKKNDRSWLIK